MRKALYIVIIVIGSLQMIGYVTGIKAVRGLGAVTCSSPLPLVFGEVKGVETYAADFYMRYTTAAGSDTMIHLTPEMYSQLKGPYNRRNVYGAAISYGPVLPERIWQPILQHGICDRSILNELGLDATGNNYSIFISTRTAGSDSTWTLTPTCSK
jgi:hypothetical protein